MHGDEGRMQAPFEIVFAHGFIESRFAPRSVNHGLTIGRRQTEVGLIAQPLQSRHGDFARMVGFDVQLLNGTDADPIEKGFVGVRDRARGFVRWREGFFQRSAKLVGHDDTGTALCLCLGKACRDHLRITAGQHQHQQRSKHQGQGAEVKPEWVRGHQQFLKIRSNHSG